jgi:hypothetical protein
MRNSALKYLMIGICLIFSGKSLSQITPTDEQVTGFLNDFTFYSKMYITPATDCAVYQASSGWMTSPKKRKLFDVTLGLYGNVFFVPKDDRSFQIKNSDFSFFTIENATSATVPTALGGDSQYYLTGQIDDTQIRFQAPDGVDQETVFYPYLQGSVSLWKGFEVVGKYSSKVKLKKGDYQVYGLGLKHNFSQYFKSLDKSKINLAALLAYSKEEIGFDFLTTSSTSDVDLGINRISGKVDTWQFQISASKEWKKFELMASSIVNVSDFEYYLDGKHTQSGTAFPVKSILNKKLKEIYTTKINMIGEISGRYQFNKFYVQTSLAFGKFANTNFSVQYEFN